LSYSLILISNKYLIFKEKNEAIFKAIFTELEKYTWNIECTTYIMDLVQIHLKELLETITKLHVQQQQNQAQHLQHLQQQQQQQTQTTVSGQTATQQQVQQQASLVHNPLGNSISIPNQPLNVAITPSNFTSSIASTGFIAAAFPSAILATTASASTNNANTTSQNQGSTGQPTLLTQPNVVQQNQTILISKLEELLGTLIQVIFYFNI
jgi:hypothetical protein